MRKTHFTKGPYAVSSYGNDISCSDHRIDCYEIISDHGEAASWLGQVMKQPNPVRPLEGLANAKLFAASFELYQELDLALTELGAIVEWTRTEGAPLGSQELSSIETRAASAKKLLDRVAAATLLPLKEK
jgi:hypothetical protein